MINLEPGPIQLKIDFAANGEGPGMLGRQRPGIAIELCRRRSCRVDARVFPALTPYEQKFFGSFFCKKELLAFLLR
jgi:hypothetical protein